MNFLRPQVSPWRPSPAHWCLLLAWRYKWRPLQSTQCYWCQTWTQRWEVTQQRSSWLIGAQLFDPSVFFCSTESFSPLPLHPVWWEVLQVIPCVSCRGSSACCLCVFQAFMETSREWRSCSTRRKTLWFRWATLRRLSWVRTSTLDSLTLFSDLERELSK